MGSLVVRTAGALSHADGARVEAIYEGAFIADLRVPFGELTRPGDADQMFVALAGGTPVGFAAFRLLGSVGWSFLRYFAIDRERRGQGLGREFWRLLQLSLREAAWPPEIIFEVEHPDDAAGDAAERLIRERRIRFWTGCGASVLPATAYVTPDFTGCGTTEPMLLLAATPAAAPPVRGDQLRRLVLAIYTDRYGVPPDDPLVSRALASVAA